MKVRLLLLTLLGIALLTPLTSQTAQALTGSQFQAGNIISDGNFFNSNAMSATDIQNFLNSKVPSCDTNGSLNKSYYYNSSTGKVSGSSFSGASYVTTSRATYGSRYDSYYKVTYAAAPYTCLKNYRQDTPQVVAESGLCGYFPARTNQTAANIIDQVSATCNINPMVLIVLLQKEQGLVTDEWPWDNQYDKATGFACPDTSGCDSAYYGFFNQVYHAARQFQRYKADPSNWNWVAGQNNNIPYNPTASCGSKWVYIQNQATAGLYNYTPYQPNKAALDNLYGSGDSCSAYGNRNFWRYYSDWFGNPAAPAPYPFKTSSSSAVYLFADGFKFTVPSMGLLQDYGFSPASIRTISDSAANAIPYADSSTGLNTGLSYVIKSPSDTDADGSTVYLVSIGKRYRITSMTQLSDFGFSGSDISHLPINLIYSLGGNTTLSNYIQAPTKLVFQISGGNKRAVLDMSTFKSLNPSGAVSPMSYSVISLFTSGLPLTNSPTVIKLTGGSAIYIYTPSEQYFSFPSFNVYSCWGAGTVTGLNLYTLPGDYAATPSPASSLSCLVKDTSNTVFLLSKSLKYSVPSTYGTFVPQILNADLTTAAGHIPTTADDLNRTVKASSSAAIWYLENGKKRPVPSMSNYHLLGLSSAATTTLEPGALDSITTGDPKLGTGQAVKSSSSSAVYVIFNDTRYGIASADDFNAYNYNWSNIETYNQAALDNTYPATGTNLNNYLYRAQNDTVYLLNPVGCYTLSPAVLTTYGKDQNQIKTNQTYSSSVMPYLSFSNCTVGSKFVKSPDRSTVYMMDAGQKRPVSSWATLTAQAGTNTPAITTLSQRFLDTFPTGSNVN
jgi:hypothetical protein